MKKPPAPPEAVLIRLAREAADIRMAEAAARAGVSVARWAQIEAGSEMRNGHPSPVTGRPGTIARMAHAVGVDPARMEGEGRRPDAAEIMREMYRQDAASRPAPAPSYDPPPFPEVTPEEQEAMAPYLAAITASIARARRDHPGEQLTGRLVFPRPAQAMWARSWDDLAATGTPVAIIAKGLAVMMSWNDEAARDAETETEGRHRIIGLPHAKVNTR